MTGGISLTLYRGLTGILAPVVPVLLRRRVRVGKEDAARLPERRGLASLPRPAGVLIWIHAASVGESLASLPLVNRLVERTGRSVLMTTGTVTSADLMRQRLPAAAFHQYAPLDFGRSASRFLEYWRPDLALFVESEIWPNLLLEVRRRNIPIALINARLSARSFRGWKRVGTLARRLFSSFDICLAQDDTVARRLTELGAPNVCVGGNLKADAPPLPVDEAALSKLRDAIGQRPVFLAASTHPGEEEHVLRTAAELRPLDVLTVIVPRHIQRGGDIARLANAEGLICTLRSEQWAPVAGTEIYIADTMGELGLFYRLARIAFLGGSLIPHGGQNPLEAARFGVPVMAGPYTENFSDVFAQLFAAQGIGRIASGAELPSLAVKLMSAPEDSRRIGVRAKTAAENLGGALNATVEIVERLLAHARS